MKLLSSFGRAAVCAVVMQPATSGAVTLLHGFAADGDGAGPVAGLTPGPGGVLYGAACQDTEVSDAGTVFSLTPPAAGQTEWQFAVLYSFPADDSGGNCPIGTLLRRHDGTLVGTTQAGGADSFGTVFALTPPAGQNGVWTETILHDFALSRDDGATPEGGVIADAHGRLFGTTVQGGRGCRGDLGCGVVYMLTPPRHGATGWHEQVIHYFKGRTGQAGFPAGDLLLQGADTLFGTTPQGVFTLSPPGSGGGAWNYQMLAVSPALPGLVATGVVADPAGTLYGMTGQGGANDTGAIFALSPPAVQGAPWTTTVLHDFGTIRHNKDGMYPAASLARVADGTLFGTVPQGGAHGGGVAFRLDLPAGAGGTATFTVLASFGGPRSVVGTSPEDRPLPRGDALFLTNAAGGSGGFGAALKIPQR
ncbi:MAG TPA: choice-of-anchor tandem repeat GloVer-containing protein [Acetobacteraceae bacterium]|nr:choice-of-anchor tandem repeat GloVer-containing protein [Acetobacteraceae bacterium]